MRLLPLAALFVAITTAAWAADAWFPFKDPDSAFSVEVPGTPTVGSDTTNAADGTVIPLITYSVDLGTAALLVMRADFTKIEVDPGAAIDGIVGKLRAGAVTIQVDQISVVDGQVGHEVSYTDKDGDHIDDRVYFYQHYVYQVMSVTPKDATDGQTAQSQRFLASFHFTPSKT
jgi:hypothetical protein